MDSEVMWRVLKMAQIIFVLLIVSLTSVFVLKAASITASTALSMSAVSKTMKAQDDPTQTETDTGTPNPAVASHNRAPS